MIQGTTILLQAGCHALVYKFLHIHIWTHSSAVHLYRRRDFFSPLQLAKIKGQLYAVVFDALLAADWKAALGVFCMQSAGYYPCVKCEAVAHKQVASTRCPQCKCWPCWHNQLLALAPEIRDAAIIKHATEIDGTIHKGVQAHHTAERDTGEDSKDTTSEGPAVSNASVGTAAACRPNLTLAPIAQDEQIYNCTVCFRTAKCAFSVLLISIYVNCTSACQCSAGHR